MQVSQSLTVRTKSPKEYEMLKAIVATYEYFTPFGTGAKWVGYDEVREQYTVIFDCEGNEDKSTEDRKNDIVDMLTYIEDGKYYFP